MNFDRLKVLSKEADIINAIINGEGGVSFNSLFEDEPEATNEFKLDKLCGIAYRVLKTTKIENHTTLLNMFNELYPDSNVGKFCIEFININVNDFGENKTIVDKINALIALEFDGLPDSQIKVDYLQTVMTLLLVQQPINIELINKFNIEFINKFNIELKKMIK